jgi:hypothetical protein
MTSLSNSHLIVLTSLEASLLIDFIDTGDFRECLSQATEHSQRQQELIHDIYESFGHLDLEIRDSAGEI